MIWGVPIPTTFQNGDNCPNVTGKSVCEYGYTRFPCHLVYTGYVRVAVCNGIIRSRAPAELVLVWAPCTCNSPRGSRSTCCQQRRSYWERMDGCIVLTVKRLWGRGRTGDTSVFTTIRPPTSGRQTTSASVSATIRKKSLSNLARIIVLSLTWNSTTILETTLAIHSNP